MFKQRCFLVDTENITDYRFIDEFDVYEEDIIIIFESKKSKPIAIEDFKRIINSSADISIETVQGDTKTFLLLRLAMDIMNYDDEYFVVSDNPDFELAKNFIENDMNIYRNKKINLINTLNL